MASFKQKLKRRTKGCFIPLHHWVIEEFKVDQTIQNTNREWYEVRHLTRRYIEAYIVIVKGLMTVSAYHVEQRHSKCIYRCFTRQPMSGYVRRTMIQDALRRILHFYKDHVHLPDDTRNFFSGG